jgi:hypothetical protein
MVNWAIIMSKGDSMAITERIPEEKLEDWYAQTPKGLMLPELHVGEVIRLCYGNVYNSNARRALFLGAFPTPDREPEMEIMLLGLSTPGSQGVLSQEHAVDRGLMPYEGKPGQWNPFLFVVRDADQRLPEEREWLDHVPEGTRLSTYPMDFASSCRMLETLEVVQPVPVNHLEHAPRGDEELALIGIAANGFRQGMAD